MRRETAVALDNRPGAGGLIGTDLAAKAAPDGHTVFFGTIGNLSVNPLLYSRLPFDMARDFAPVTHVASVSSALLVHPAFPVKTVPGHRAPAGRGREGAAPAGGQGQPGGAGSGTGRQHARGIRRVHETGIGQVGKGDQGG